MLHRYRFEQTLMSSLVTNSGHNIKPQNLCDEIILEIHVHVIEYPNDPIDDFPIYHAGSVFNHCSVHCPLFRVSSIYQWTICMPSLLC